MIKDIIETLNFFKYLYEVEIDELNTEEKVRLNDTIHSVASQLFFRPKKISAIARVYATDGAWDEIYELWLRDIQAWFKDKFFQIMTTITKDHEWEYSEWSRGKELFKKGSFIPTLLIPFDIKLLSEDINLEDFTISAKIVIKPEYKTEDGDVYTRWDPEWRKNSKIKVSPGIKLKEGLLVGFLKAINGLPPDAFRLCAACGKWYFHLSKRERKYCSEKCTKKMQARKRREKERQKRAKKSNDRKTKAKSGSDVQITRRPGRNKKFDRSGQF